MKCDKCGGMMTSDYMLDLRDDTGAYGFEPWRCMLCGEVTDPVILANRQAQDQGDAPQPSKQRKRRHSAA